MLLWTQPTTRWSWSTACLWTQREHSVRATHCRLYRLRTSRTWQSSRMRRQQQSTVRVHQTVSSSSLQRKDRKADHKSTSLPTLMSTLHATTWTWWQATSSVLSSTIIMEQSRHRHRLLAHTTQTGRRKFSARLFHMITVSASAAPLDVCLIVWALPTQATTVSSRLQRWTVSLSASTWHQSSSTTCWQSTSILKVPT